MSNINFSNGEISLLRLHYLQEYNNTRKKLEDIISILKKLGVSDSDAESVKSLTLSASASSLPLSENGLRTKRKYTRRSTPSPTKNINLPVEESIPKKRGRKPKKISWAKFAIKTLTNSPKPLSAPEILNAGADQFGVTDANRSKAMQALQATLFRLTKKTNELKSDKVKGSYVTYTLAK